MRSDMRRCPYCDVMFTPECPLEVYVGHIDRAHPERTPRG